MPDEKTSGIIVRTRLLTETSLIVHWLTPDLGRIATVAKGARRPKSTFRGKLDLFYLEEFSFARSARSELHNLREVMLRDTHGALREDLGRLQQASYASSFIEQATETETPIPEVYDLMLSFLRHLVSSAPTPLAVFAFELRMLEILGLTPELAETELSTAGQQVALTLQTADWPEIAQLAVDLRQENELRQFLHGFLIYHLNKLPRGRAEALHSPA